MTWGYTAATDRQNEATLAFGVDGTDAVTAILRCRPGSGRIVISTFPDMAHEGVVVLLRSGSAVSRRRSHAEPDEAADGYLVQTAVSARDPVARPFRQGARLSISVGRERTRLPPAPKALTARFFGSCG
jgi:hypothetical protein